MARKVQTFGPSGVILDEVPAAVPADAYTQCQNFRVEGAGMKLCNGMVPHHAMGVMPKFGMLAPQGSIGYALFMGSAGVSVSDGGSQLVLDTPAGWSDFTAGTMSGAMLGGIAAFNYRGDPPWYWDGTTVPGCVKPLPGWIAGKQARVIGAFGQHLFAGSLYGATDEDEIVAWSDAAPNGLVPASWTPTATNQAGQLALSVGAGPVQALKSLGNQLLVYRSSGIFSMTYAGLPYVYTAQLVSEGAGASSMNCVLGVKGTHVVITQGDIVQTDGTSVRSIGEGRLKDWLFSQMSRTGLTLAHGYVNTQRSEAVFNVALGRDDACNFAVVWNFERDKWSVRELPELTHAFMGLLPNTPALLWDTDAGTWNADQGWWDEGRAGGFALRPFGCSPTQGAQVLDTGDKRWTGENLVGTIERTGLRIGDGDAIAKVQRLIPAIEGSPGAVVEIQVGAQLAANGPISWGSAQQFILGQSSKVDCNARGRFIAVRFKCAGPEQPTVAGFSIEYDDGGRQ
jgi:hypothetical protein